MLASGCKFLSPFQPHLSGISYHEQVVEMRRAFLRAFVHGHKGWVVYIVEVRCLRDCKMLCRKHCPVLSSFTQWVGGWMGERVGGWVVMDANIRSLSVRFRWPEVGQRLARGWPEVGQTLASAFTKHAIGVAKTRSGVPKTL